MKTLFLLLLIFSFNFLNAQGDFKTVNRNDVEKIVSDSLSPNYYPNILQRFLTGDSTLGNDEYRLLYYGFVFQKNYTGYPDLQQKEINEAIKAKEYDKAIALCDAILLKFPINLFGYYNKGLAIYLRNKEDITYQQSRNRFSNLMSAIISSGDGLTCETAFKTIFVNDEYNVMYKYFQIEKFTGQALIGLCDKMSISPSQYFKAEAMYFDTSETILYMQKIFDKK